MRPWPRLSVPRSSMPQKLIFPATCPGMPKKIVAVVHELRALRQAAEAQVIEAHGPIGSLRAVLDAQQLVGGPIGEDLRAENAVFR